MQASYLPAPRPLTASRSYAHVAFSEGHTTWYSPSSSPPHHGRHNLWLRAFVCFKTSSWITGSPPIPRQACLPSLFPRLPCYAGLPSLTPVFPISSSRFCPCPSKKTHFTPRINFILCVYVDPLSLPILALLTTVVFKDPFHETKRIIQDFLNGLRFQSPRTPRNLDLRQQLAAEIASWTIDVSATFTEKMLHNSCNMAECCYSHESPEHQYFIALYTAFTFYADDHCGADPEPIGQFAQRCLEGAPQLDPVLDRFAAHLTKAFDLWPRVGANAIISGTFDSMTAMYIEYTTKGTATRPGATRYPYYVRTKSGVGPPYAHFVFPSSWRPGVNSYIQIIPEMDYFINCTNDLLSFYKESLAGETDNYVHLRAAAERESPTDVLRTLAAEVTDTVRRIDAITSVDPELAALWQRFLHGYLEFHVKTTRYRLAELGFYA